MHPLETSINGQPAEWDRPIWELWYTHVDCADPKLYDTHGIPVAANWMPAGRTSACFSFTLKDGRTFHQVIP